jgi:mRNA-degrading endonuclease toxin of MazEF toxin-antitoxin module
VEVTQGCIYLYEPPTTSGSPQAAAILGSGSEQLGLRPFIIVSRDSVNANKPTAVGVPLTTKVHKANSYRILLPAAELIADVGCFPLQASVALCDHVRVLDLERVQKRIGKVSQNALAAVGLGLAFVFDLR